MIREGREFTSKGEPLRDYPVCLFYSTGVFGTPPTAIHRGSSWHFTSTTRWGGIRKINGVATVESLDAEKSLVGLRVVMRAPEDTRLDSLIDVVITGGGIIESEIDRTEYAVSSAVLKDVGTPSYVVDWDMRRR